MKNESYLIQRLQRPHVPMGRLKDNPFAFGGRLRNGGLSDEAMDLLRPVFAFDYMGAAEFEFGAVPEALSGMVKDELTTFTFSVIHKGESHLMYGIARTGDAPDIPGRVQSWMLPYGKRPRMKEQPMLERSLDGEDDWAALGWLELDNGFFVFIDKEMWTATAAIFGLKVDPGQEGGEVKVVDA